MRTEFRFNGACTGMRLHIIRLTRSTREDSRGFRLSVRHDGRALLALSLHHWRLPRWQGPQPLGFTLTLQLGRGAGYRGGRTAYLARNARGGDGGMYTAVRGFRAGFTRDFNAIPYSFR